LKLLSIPLDMGIEYPAIRCNLAAPSPSLETARQFEIALRFQGDLAQIGDASTGTNHLRAFVGPAAECNFYCAGFRPAGRGCAYLARRQDAGAADGDTGAVA
jgi:hypothetical protein